MSIDKDVLKLPQQIILLFCIVIIICRLRLGSTLKKGKTEIKLFTILSQRYSITQKRQYSKWSEQNQITYTLERNIGISQTMAKFGFPEITKNVLNDTSLVKRSSVVTKGNIINQTYVFIYSALDNSIQQQNI